LIFLTIIGTLLYLPIVAMYYDVHTLLGVEARTVALVDTALATQSLVRKALAHNP
jgi:hypothetical protein